MTAFEGKYDRSYRFEAEDIFYFGQTLDGFTTMYSTYQYTPVLRNSKGNTLYANNPQNCAEYPCGGKYLRTHVWDMSKKWCGVKYYGFGITYPNGTISNVYPSWHPLECDA